MQKKNEIFIDVWMLIVVILPKLGADFTFATDPLKFSIERFL